MPLFRIRVVREEGPEPVTGEHIERDEEVVQIEGDSLWMAARRAWLLMEMNPHGRLLRYYNADTGEEITPPRPERVFRSGQFALDIGQGPYAGYTDGDGWNGWATPYFELEVARKIAEDYVRTPELVRVPEVEPGDYRAAFDEAEDAFLFYDPVNDDEAYFYAQNITVEGQEMRVYPIGTREWTWVEVPDDPAREMERVNR